LAFWDELDGERRQQLFDELAGLDLEEVTQSFHRCLNQAEDQVPTLDPEPVS
jgi:hypothetical protein